MSSLKSILFGAAIAPVLAILLFIYIALSCCLFAYEEVVTPHKVQDNRQLAIVFARLWKVERRILVVS